MQFQDDLAAGTVLVRPAFQSPDYVSGSAGWAVMLDGSAEFNDVTIRGGTTIGGTSLYYNGTPALGNLLLSIASAAGTDAYGNTYADGMTVYGTNGTIQTSTVDTVTNWLSTSGAELTIGVGGASAAMTLTPATVSGVTWEPGYLVAGTTSALGTDTPATEISSPYNTSSVSRASISLFGSAGTPSGTVTNEVLVTTQRMWVTGDTVIGGTLSAANFPDGAWTTWTPTWVTSTGANLPSYGNATFDCRYTQVGKTVMAHVDITFGTTTNFGAAPGTGDNWRFGLPATAAATMGCAGWLEINAGTAARAVCRARLTTTGAFELEFSSGLTDGSNPVNKGLIDAVTPFTWTSGDSIRGTLMYEAA